MTELERVCATVAVAVGVPVTVRQRLVSETNAAWQVALGGELAVLRIPGVRPPPPAVEPAREFAAHRLAAQHGLAPELLYADSETGVLVTRWVQGGAFPDAGFTAPGVLSRVGERMARLHRLPTDSLPQRPHLEETADVYFDMVAPSARTTAAGLRGAVQAAADPQAPTVLCHNDLCAQNIMQSTPIQFIDWEYATLGNAWADIALLGRNAVLSDAELEQVVCAYLGRSPGTDEREELERQGAAASALLALWRLAHYH